MFHVYLLVAYLYLLWRFILLLPIGTWRRIVVAAFVLSVAQYHLIVTFLYGTMFSPEFPRWLVIVAGWLFCSFVLLTLFVLVGDLLALAIVLSNSSRIRIGIKFRVFISALAVVLAAIGVSQAIKVPGIKEVEVQLGGLPKAFDGMTLVQISDLHISRLFQAGWVNEVVGRVNSLNADLILVTGDVVDGYVNDRVDDVAPLADLNARVGVIAIPGNHEYYFGAGSWIARFEQLGMRVLVNSHLDIVRGGQRLIIAGVTDEAGPAFGMDGPDLKKALSGVAGDEFTLLLKHRPQDADLSAEADVDLQLSGHTHGGMIAGLGLLAADANDGYVSGRYRIGSMQLYVSNGTGLWNGFPIRIGVMPEITKIVLRSSLANQ